MTTTTRDTILDAIAAFIESRPGLDWRNYGDGPAYRAEARAITQDLHHARALLAAVRWRSSIDAPQLLDALRHNFSGRLSWDDQRQALEYCTGQYYPTEYRRAACAVLAGALWAHWRECTITPVAATPADRIRMQARRELGAAIARRWFN